MNKVESYIGFAIKAKKIITGQSLLKHSKEKFYLVLVCSSASKNLINLATNIAQKNECELIVSNILLDEVSHIKDVKIMAITDENLSQAIIKNKEILIGYRK